MAARIAIVQGRPDRGGGHFGNALADVVARPPGRLGIRAYFSSTCSR